MTTKRLSRLAALVALGTLGLTACGGTTTTTVPQASTTTSSATTSLVCPAGKIVGGGSTAQKLAMETLTSDYSAECGGKATIEYAGTGSGAGIKDFYNGQLDFAGSDSALKSEPNKDNVVETAKVEARCTAPGWNLPIVVSPVAFAYNLAGVD
ncbi:MAG TPA: substrate-binding domain-containing protein, partial [Propionibacteriaceae bacterium]|nr:substrate-binding domain-containing protein [Propionibacteriaceae bacterium]